MHVTLSRSALRISPRRSLTSAGLQWSAHIDAPPLMEIPMTKSKTKAPAKRAARNAGASRRLTIKHSRPTPKPSKLVKSNGLKTSSSARADSKQAKVLSLPSRDDVSDAEPDLQLSPQTSDCVRASRSRQPRTWRGQRRRDPSHDALNPIAVARSLLSCQ